MKYIYAAYSGVGLRTHLNHAFKVADHCDPLILADQSALRVLTGQVPRKDLYARVSGPRDPRSRWCFSEIFISVECWYWRPETGLWHHDSDLSPRQIQAWRIKIWYCVLCDMDLDLKIRHIMSGSEKRSGPKIIAATVFKLELNLSFSCRNGNGSCWCCHLCHCTSMCDSFRSTARTGFCWWS